MRIILAKLLKGIYRISPVKKGLNRLIHPAYKFLFYNSKDPVFKTTSIGNPKFISSLDLRDRHEFLMYIKGLHEPDTEILFKELITDCKTFVDIGGYIGYYTLLAARLNKDIKVVTFEPFKRNCELIDKNISLNNFKNIQLREIAISDRKGLCNFDIPDLDHECGWGKLKNTDNLSAESIPVNTDTLDSQLKKLGNISADVIKIDAEGHELSVLKGACETLSKPGRRHLIIEINVPVLTENMVDPSEINRFLLGLNYKPFRIDNGGKITSSTDCVEESNDMNYYYLKEK